MAGATGLQRGVLLKKLRFFPKPGILAPRVGLFFVTAMLSIMERCFACPVVRLHWSDDQPHQHRNDHKV